MLVTAVSVSTFLFSSPVSAEIVVHTSQLNVHGKYIGALTYASDPSHLHPLVITANEVCSAPPGSLANKLHQLVFTLGLNGYGSTSFVQQNFGSGLCSEFGGAPTYNYVGGLGQNVSSGSYVYPSSVQSPYEMNRGTYRNAVCIRTNLYFQYFACSTQLASRGTDYIYALSQAYVLRSDYLAPRLGTGQLIGGDFNMRPDHSGSGKLRILGSAWPRWASVGRCGESASCGGWS